MFRKLSVVSLFLVLCIGVSAFAAEGYKVTVYGQKTADREEKGSSKVRSMDFEEIEAVHAESLVNVLERSSSVSFAGYGSLGSLQSPRVRGLGAGRTVVMINGVPCSSDYDTVYSFDISSIPVDSVEKIEIVSSGASAKGFGVAAGGIINIITKKPSQKQTGRISIENGSLIKSAFDSQKVDLMYSAKGLLTSFGFQRALNKYRENADMFSLSGLVGYSYEEGEFGFDTSNSFFFEKAGLPGSTDNPSPEDWQSELRVTSVNNVQFSNYDLDICYTLNPYWGENNGNFEFQTHVVNADFSADYGVVRPYFRNSVQIMKNPAFEPSIRGRYLPVLGTSFEYDFDTWSLFANGDCGFATDLKKFVPSGCLGAELYMGENVVAFADAAYGNKLPSFSDMYYPDNGWQHGNKDLRSEHAVSANAGMSYEDDNLQASMTGFFKYLKDAIVWASDENGVYVPYNLESSVYSGFEINVDYGLPFVKVSAGWLFNKSFDLKTKTQVTGIRTNTVTLAVNANLGKFSFEMDGKYLGKYYKNGEKTGSAFIVNAGASFRASDNLEMYLKADNVLDLDYCLTEGYPMPGIKFRMGVNYDFN